MRLVDGVVAREEHLDDLVVVVVSGEYERGDVGRELGFLVRPKERVLLRALVQLGAGDVVRMFDHDLRMDDVQVKTFDIPYFRTL